jgi:hypothetical protein
LHEAVDDYFTTAQQHAFKAVPYAYTEELDKDHGRLETRRYWITDDLSTMPKTDRWAGLRSIGMVERECIQGGNSTLERRFFIAESVCRSVGLTIVDPQGSTQLANIVRCRLTQEDSQ